MLKQWTELTSAEKRQIALRVSGLRAVDSAAMAAQALIDGREQDALNFAGEARAIIRLALRQHKG